METTGNQNSQNGNLSKNYKEYARKQNELGKEVSRKDWRDYKTENGIGGGFDNFMTDGAGGIAANAMNSIAPTFTLPKDLI